MVDLSLTTGDLLYDYNASGEVTISRAFEDYPSLSGVTLSMTGPQAITARATLYKGATVTALGQSWIIADLSWAQQHRYQNRHELTLELQHPLAPRDSEIVSRQHPLDEPRDISGMLVQGCLNLRSLIAYSGGRDWHIPFGIPDDELRVTPRELLTEYRRRLHVNGGFLYWGGTVPTVRDWARQATHTIPKVLNESLEVNEPGMGATIDGVQLTNEVVNLEFVPDGDYAGAEFDYCETLRVEEPRNGASNFSSTEAAQFRDALSKGSIWFDAGGPTKESSQERRCNGATVWTRTQKYGLRGTSIGAYARPMPWRMATIVQSHFVKSEMVEGERVYSVAVRGLGNFTLAQSWGKFSDITEHVERDRAGYCTARYQDGWLVYRFRTESNAEAAQTHLEEQQKEDEFIAKIGEVNAATGNAKQVKQNELADLRDELTELRKRNHLIRQSYAAFHIHYYNRQNSRVEYILNTLCNFYADLHFTTQNPRRFCVQEIAVSSWLATMPDPADYGKELEEGESPSLLSTGERYEKIKTIKVVTPALRGDTRKPERYSEELRETNAEGAEFKDRITLHPITEHDGRPSEHDRVKTYGWGQGQLPFPPADPEGEKTLILNSPGTGYTGSEPPRGEWSAPGVWRQDQAIAAMNLELSIENTQNAKTTTFKVPTDLAIVEGDTLLYKGERWIVLGITQAFTLKTGIARCETMEVRAGRLMAFGGIWQAVYPTTEDYPPNLVYPGVENPPTSVSAQRVDTFGESVAIMPFFSGNIIAEVVRDPQTAPAIAPFDSGDITSNVLIDPAIEAAIFPHDSGDIISAAILYPLVEPAIAPFDSGDIPSEVVGYQETGTAIAPFTSGDIVSDVVEYLQTRPAIAPFTSRTIQSSSIEYNPTATAPMAHSSGNIQVSEVAFFGTAPTPLPHDSGDIPSSIATTNPTDPALFPHDSGDIESSIVVTIPTGSAAMPYGSGDTVSSLVEFDPTSSAAFTHGGGDIQSAIVVFNRTGSIAMPHTSGNIPSEVI